jgi:hypothetical protein
MLCEPPLLPSGNPGSVFDPSMTQGSDLRFSCTVYPESSPRRARDWFEDIGKIIIKELSIRR